MITTKSSFGLCESVQRLQPDPRGRWVSRHGPGSMLTAPLALRMSFSIRTSDLTLIVSLTQETVDLNESFSTHSHFTGTCFNVLKATKG